MIDHELIISDDPSNQYRLSDSKAIMAQCKAITCPCGWEYHGRWRGITLTGSGKPRARTTQAFDAHVEIHQILSGEIPKPKPTLMLGVYTSRTEAYLWHRHIVEDGELSLKNVDTWGDRIYRYRVGWVRDGNWANYKRVESPEAAMSVAFHEAAKARKAHKACEIFPEIVGPSMTATDMVDTLVEDIRSNVAKLESSRDTKARINRAIQINELLTRLDAVQTYGREVVAQVLSAD